MLETLNSGLLLGASSIAFASYGFITKVTTKDNSNKICNYTELKSLMGNGVLLSENVRLSVKQSNTHILMIAPSDSGKSRRFAMHNVNRLQNCSMVVTDPSCEIERTCKPNKKTYILNPFSENTVGYDPLQSCRSEFEVRKIAKVILMNGMNSSMDNSKSNQADWINMSTPLLTAYMLMNYHTKKYTFDAMIKNICTMPILPIKDKPVMSILQEIADSKVESAILEMQAFIQVMGAVQTLSSIRTVMNTCLQLFFDSNLKKVFHRENFDISKLRKEESVIYIQIPEHHSDYFSPLVATFLTQMYDYLLENNGLQIYCIYDEMANIGIIPNICNLLSTIRKHSVSIVGAIQSLTQLSTLYGELKGKELQELFKTLIICGGLRGSADHISDILGTKEEDGKPKPLMTSDEIRRMDKNEILIICNNKRPVIDKMMRIVV